MIAKLGMHSRLYKPDVHASQLAHSITLAYMDFGAPPSRFFAFIFERIPNFVSSELMFVDINLEALEGPHLGPLISDP